MAGCALFVTEQVSLMRFFRRATGSSSLARDMAQEAFLRRAPAGVPQYRNGPAAAGASARPGRRRQPSGCAGRGGGPRGAIDRQGPTPRTLAELRTETGEYHRDHLRVLAQRVEVMSKSEIRLMGNKSDLLRALAAASSTGAAANGVRGFIPKWRARRDSNS